MGKSLKHSFVSAFVEVRDSQRFLMDLNEFIGKVQDFICRVAEFVDFGCFESEYMTLMEICTYMKFVKLKTEEFGKFIPFNVDSNEFRILSNPCNDAGELYLLFMEKYLNLIGSKIDLLTGNAVSSSLEESKIEERNDRKDCIFFLKKSGKILVKFNVLTHDVTEKPLHLRYNDISSSILCQVSSSLLFLHGGRDFNMQFFGFSFLINTNSMSYVRLPEGLIRGSATGLLHNNKIFIFGGYLKSSYRGVKLRTSNYFDLKMNSWRPLSDLPEPQYGTSACLIENSILLTGRKHNFLQLYSIERDFFLNLNAKVSISMANLLIKYNEKVFLVTSSNVYQAFISDLTKWRIVSNSTKGFANSLTYDIAYSGKFAYFSDCYGFIFQFDCEEASMKIITQVEETL